MRAKTIRRDPGAGSIYKRKDGKWVAALTLPADPITNKQRRKVKTASTATEARKKLAEMRAEKDAGTLTLTRSPTLDDYAQIWLQKKKDAVKPKTWGGYESKYRLYIQPYLGGKRLEEITPIMIDETLLTMRTGGEQLGVRRRKQELSPTTQRAAWRVLADMLHDATTQGLMPRDPCAATEPPAAAANRYSEMPLEDVMQFYWANADDPYLARFILALETTARQGEVLGLELDRLDMTPGKEWVAYTWELQRIPWEHGCSKTGTPQCGKKRGADCPKRRIHIPPKYESQPVYGALHLLRPKSRTSRRPIALGEFAVAVMRRYLSANSPQRFVFEIDGHPIDYRKDYEIWCKMLDRANLPHYQIHSLRHSAATFMNDAGVELEMRRGIMGHSSTDMTDHYTHRNVEEQLPAISALDKYIQSGLEAGKKAWEEKKAQA